MLRPIQARRCGVNSPSSLPIFRAKCSTKQSKERTHRKQPVAAQDHAVWAMQESQIAFVCGQCREVRCNLRVYRSEPDSKSTGYGYNQRSVPRKAQQCLLSLTFADCFLQQGLLPSGQSVGVKRLLENLALLENPEEILKEPWTQEAPATTEDMLLETEAAISALGESTTADLLDTCRVSKRGGTCRDIYIRRK